MYLCVFLFVNLFVCSRESGLFTDWPHAALKDLCIVSKKVEVRKLYITVLGGVVAALC